MTQYPYDEEVLDLLARRLYAALPAMYRVPDERPGGPQHLRRFLEVLAVPPAVLHQSLAELHADLFVDTGHDRMLPYLAEMVGTRLVFPDAVSNRRDVRGTVAWRRRKGTPPALEEMAAELTGRSVVVQEGWKRVLVTQDLDLPRPERVIPDLRPSVVAEQATGPLDALAHAVDVRAISARTGRHHPRHVTHWVQPTVTFPLREATAAARSVPGSDVRFAFDPLGGRDPLRARRAADEREPFVDRIPELHFAARPERWWDRDGGFVVRVCGLAAGIAGPSPAERVADTDPAGRDVAAGTTTLTLLDHPSRGWRGGVRVELGLATVNAAGPDAWRPNPASFVLRAGVDLDASGVAGTTAGAAAAPGTRVPLLRLTPVGGAASRFFPGATLEIASDAPGATAAAADSERAREGFLRGVLHVRIPPLQVLGERHLHVAADGSVYDVADDDGNVLVMPGSGPERRLDPSALLTAGPGAAWPALPPQGEPRYLGHLPGAPGRGPALLHGGRVLRRTGGGDFATPPAGVACALVLAAQIDRPGGPAFRPFVRLRWTGPDPAGATWEVLGAGGEPVLPAAAATELAAVAATYHEDPARQSLALRFECSAADATLCPAEVAWTAGDGATTLIHLPQLDAAPPPAAWPAAAPFNAASEAVRAAEDGSTWASDSTANRRFALGAVAPIAEAAGLRRRRVRRRRLCAWDNEDWGASPPATLALTDRGRLDVDVAHGLFAFAAEEPPQPWPAGPLPGVPPSVTTDHEEGATMHLGALPAAREPVLELRLPTPTRLVTRNGALHPDAPADWHAIPRYASLTAALDAVDQRWSTIAPADVDGIADPGTVARLDEVVQFEDSATYELEAPAWPRRVADPVVRARALLTLTIQAAERERPVVLVDPGAGWTLPATAAAYESLTLRGIALGGDGWSGMDLPAAERCSIELCTVLHADNALRLGGAGGVVRARLVRSATAGLEIAGPGLLIASDTIVDARGAAVEDAIAAPAAEVVLDRVSVGGEVRARVLEASEAIFASRAAVEDRFHGCVRYSRVTADSVLPRVHRVTVDTAVDVVSRNRRDAAWWRLAAEAPATLTRGAETGSEIGAFSATRAAERMAGFERRLEEYTPAGLVTGIVRVD